MGQPFPLHSPRARLPPVAGRAHGVAATRVQETPVQADTHDGEGKKIVSICAGFLAPGSRGGGSGILFALTADWGRSS